MKAAAYLPDFCRLPRIAAVCGIVQLVVVLIYISPSRTELGSIGTFAYATAFAQWLALTVALVLCKARERLGRFPPWLGFTLAALLPAMITAVAAWFIYVIDRATYSNVLQAIGPWRFVFSIALMIGLLTAVMLRYFYVREQWQEQVRVNAKASLQALQARINPHFLFNSMNTIAALVQRDPATAETAIEDLSDLFRAALGDDDADSTLAQELQIVRQYLAIEQLRLGDRLCVDWQLPEDLPMACPMPRLMLQPLFENAVIHGIAQLPEGGIIRFEARQQAEHLQFTLSNPLPLQAVIAGHGHALSSVKKRLELFYGSRASIQESQQDGLFISVMSVPYA